MPGDIRIKLGDIKYGHFNRNLQDVKHFIFIRHGEKAGPLFRSDAVAASCVIARDAGA